MTLWATDFHPVCLICGTEVQHHGLCNGCVETGRKLNECDDCCVVAPCICEIAEGTAYPMSHAEQAAEASGGRR